jgi:hypothetical protein
MKFGNYFRKQATTPQANKTIPKDYKIEGEI